MLLLPLLPTIWTPTCFSMCSRSQWWVSSPSSSPHRYQGDKEEEITIGNKTSATQTSNQEPDLKETLVKINMELGNLHDRPAKMEQHRLDSITLDRRMSENLSNHPQGGNNQTNVTWSGSNPS